MRIRSITYFIHPKWPVDEQAIQQAAAFSLAARQAYESAGFKVQTTRLASIPFPQILPELSSKNLLSLAQQMEEIVRQSDFEYVSLGPALPDQPQAYELIPEAQLGGETDLSTIGAMLGFAVMMLLDVALG